MIKSHIIQLNLTQSKVEILPQNKPKKPSRKTRKNPNNDVVVEKNENNVVSLENINIDYEPTFFRNGSTVGFIFLIKFM